MEETNKKTIIKILEPDFLTEDEAAAYCCISKTLFRLKTQEFRIPFCYPFGAKKNIFRRSDLKVLLEHGFNCPPIAPSSPSEITASEPVAVEIFYNNRKAKKRNG